MSFRLSRADRIDIDTTLERFLEMKPDHRASVVKSIEQGVLCVFGYGTLMGAPHAHFDFEFPALVTGVRRDAAFSDRHYRGTPGRLGITMGLVPTNNPDDKAHGLVRVIRRHQDEEVVPFLGRVRRGLLLLAKRETSFNPIYDYHAVQAYPLKPAHDFTSAAAIICGTATDHKQYIGPTLEIDNGRGLTKEHKAAIIAGSLGSRNADTPRKTGLAYWRFALNDQYKYQKAYGIAPDAHLVELVEMANAYRSKLRPSLQARLSRVEDIPERAGFDERVFRVDPAAALESGRKVAALRWDAWNRMGREDPLPSARQTIIARNMQALTQMTREAA